MIKQAIIVVGSLLAGAWLQEKYDVLGKTVKVSKKVISEAKNLVNSESPKTPDDGSSSNESE